MVIEPISSSIAIVASILSIAASVKSLKIRYRLTAKDALARFLGKASEEEKNLLGQPGIEEAVFELMIISEKLLEQLSHEAHECEKNHILARQSTKDQLVKDIADIQGSGCMCSTLRAIRKHNKMRLPEHGPFKDWWESYNCT
ncbi:TPA: hypothetical protein RY214_002261 [Pseudomonas aeruginosa]|uniref:hypothetical protein n=1 Tax=Pseudomonas aeruginosa TaxID=287 RepID=UPI00106CF1F1|nr:hypothetical protein [Pseudomonas aeruginosa]